MGKPAAKKVVGTAANGSSVNFQMHTLWDLKTCDAVEQLCLAIAFNAGNTQDLTTANIQIDMIQNRMSFFLKIKIMNRKSYGTGALRAFHNTQFHMTAHHHIRKFVEGRFFGIHVITDHVSIPQNHNAIRNSLGFLEFMRDDDDTLAAGAKIVQHYKEIFYLMRGQNSSRFVQNDYFRFPVKCLEDLHPLLFAN